MADEGMAVDVPAGLEWPAYVVTDEDKARWQNAGTVARDALGDAATTEAVWQMQRTIFHDRETYPD